VTLHRNAKTCLAGRLLLCARRAAAWLKRFREEGQAGLDERASAPRRIPHKTSPEREEAIVALRDVRFTAAGLAEALGMAHSTVSAVLKRLGRGRLPRVAEPDNRYEPARAS
jgi:DNA-binding transcriptional ArsR family regulator